jgi:hypothetical protein
MDYIDIAGNAKRLTAELEAQGEKDCDRDYTDGDEHLLEIYEQ